MIEVKSEELLKELEEKYGITSQEVLTIYSRNFFSKPYEIMFYMEKIQDLTASDIFNTIEKIINPNPLNRFVSEINQVTIKDKDGNIKSEPKNWIEFVGKWYDKRVLIKPILLLDLNYTLVANSQENKHIRPYQKKIEREEYRKWLVDMIRNYYVILITARPEYQKKVTIESLENKLGGWMPQEMYFQEKNDSPPVAKEKLLRKYILSQHGNNGDFFAIESNPKTKLMYKKYSIPSVSINDKDRKSLISEIENRGE